jgi:hypothetical protein
LCSSMQHCRVEGENMVPAHDGCTGHISYSQEMHEFVVARCKAGVQKKVILEGALMQALAPGKCECICATASAEQIAHTVSCSSCVKDYTMTLDFVKNVRCTEVGCKEFTQGWHKAACFIKNAHWTACNILARTWKNSYTRKRWA